MTTALARLVRVPDDEYAPASPLSIPALSIARFSGDGGTSSLSFSAQNFSSGTASISFGFSPGQVLATAHEANHVATIQSWSSSGFVVTLANRNDAGTYTGTVGFGYIALE